MTLGVTVSSDSTSSSIKLSTVIFETSFLFFMPFLVWVVKFMVSDLKMFWSEFSFWFWKIKCWVIDLLCVWRLHNSVSLFSNYIMINIKFLLGFVSINAGVSLGNSKGFFIFIFVLCITQNYTSRSNILLFSKF